MTANSHDSEPLPPPHESSLEEFLQEAGRDEPFIVADLAHMNPGFESDEEIDEFIAALREWRNASLARAMPR